MRTRADTTAPTVELDLESALLRVSDHIGVFYRGDAERDTFVVPLVGAAVAAGCGVIYVCDRSTPHQVAEQLEDAEPGVADAVARDQVRIVASHEVYLAGGRFDPDATVGFYSDGLARCARDGYPVTCVIGEMSWSLRGCPGTERLIEYEARYAEEFDAATAITLCLYDLEQTRGEQLYDLLRVHDRVVLNGIEMHSPHLDPALLPPGRGGRG